jgi:multiple antibiotic resistance protein
VFFALTADDTTGHRRLVAVRIALYVVGILLVFALFGSFVLEFFGISLPVLKIAGGLIVAHSAWSMVTAKSRLTPQERSEATEQEDIAFTPMAMPMLAGPGAIGAVMALVARPTMIFETYLGVGIAILIMGLVVLLLLIAGEPLARRLGPGGLGVVNRVFGFLLLAISVQLISNGLTAIYPIITGHPAPSRFGA